MKEMNEQELLIALASPGDPLAIFLYTPLCGTCKAARRMLEVAAHLLPPEVVIAGGNVNMLPELVSRYRISSVPALLVAPGDRQSAAEIHYAMGSVENMLEYIRRVIKQ
jgi:thioredoxin-like negative regulator of GroEL